MTQRPLPERIRRLAGVSSLLLLLLIGADVVADPTAWHNLAFARMPPR